eukprot:6213216-Pleurochrysis_carterae.AAC.1
MTFQRSSRTRWSRSPPLVTSPMILPSLLNHAAHLAGDDVFIVTDDVADYFPHLSLAPTEYWFSTLATLLLSDDKGFSHGDKLAFVTEYVLGFGLLYAPNYAQRLSIVLLAVSRCEFRPDVGKNNHATLAWLHARELHLGADEARMHTALMYTDDVVLAAVGTDRIVALLRTWRKVTSSIGLLMAIPEKRQASSAVLWLEIVFVAAAGVLFLPRDKAVRAVERIQRTLSHSTDTAALRKLCGLLKHVRGVWVGPPSWMHGFYHHLRGDPDPAALVRPTPFACRQLLRWQTRLSRNNCIPLLAVATPLTPTVRELCYVPILFVSMDAAKAHQRGQLLGLGVYCHGLLFSLPLAPRSRHANSIATLELMALVAAIATCHPFFRALSSCCARVGLPFRHLPPRGRQSKG